MSFYFLILFFDVPQEGIPAVLQGAHWLLLSHWRHLHWITPLPHPHYVLNTHYVHVSLVLHSKLDHWFIFVRVLAWWISFLTCIQWYSELSFSFGHVPTLIPLWMDKITWNVPYTGNKCNINYPKFKYKYLILIYFMV